MGLGGNTGGRGGVVSKPSVTGKKSASTGPRGSTSKTLTKKSSAAKPPVSAGRAAPPHGKTAQMTDLANAERLVQLYGPDLGFVGSWQKPISWDGRRWAIDDNAKWSRCAAGVARIIYAEGDARCKTDPEDKIGAAIKAWGRKSQSAERLGAMVRTTQLHIPSVRIPSHNVLDKNAWLFNVQNGTIDLHTGKLKPHNRKDWITKIAPVAHDEKAVCPTWDKFLKRVMHGDRTLIEYLQRIVGYCLTGVVDEHVLFFFYGGGANGKSTFLNVIHGLLGEYASPAPRGLVFKQQNSQHDTRYAMLHGKRYVTCSEIEEGQMFDEALVKDLTGGDPIEARRMREDYWSFLPSHKLFLAGNHKPTVRGDDEGIWRRLRLIPWTVQIPPKERDKNLTRRLLKELPGILRWAVQGCIAWQKTGLNMPAVVEVATKQYRSENDILGQFFKTNLRFDVASVTPRYLLRELYERYCKDNGVEPLGARRFAGSLRERGATDTTKLHDVEAIPYGPNAREGGKRVVDAWRGVRVLSDKEKMHETAAAAERQLHGVDEDDDADEDGVAAEDAKPTPVRALPVKATSHVKPSATANAKAPVKPLSGPAARVLSSIRKPKSIDGDDDEDVG